MGFFNLYHQKPLIGVKGRIQTRVIQSDDGSKKKKTEIIAEKVTFLSSNKTEAEEAWSSVFLERRNNALL